MTDLQKDFLLFAQQFSVKNSTVTSLTSEFLPNAIIKDQACINGTISQTWLLSSNKNPRYMLWFSTTQPYNTCQGSLSPMKVVAIVSL